MTVRITLAIVVLAVLAGCHPELKGLGESGQPVYYDPSKGISSDGLVYKAR